MSIQDLLSQLMQIDFKGLAAFIGANAAFLRSIAFDKVVSELLVPWMKHLAIPEAEQQDIIEQVHKIIHRDAGNTLGFTSSASVEHIRNVDEPPASTT